MDSYSYWKEQFKIIIKGYTMKLEQLSLFHRYQILVLPHKQLGHQLQVITAQQPLFSVKLLELQAPQKQPFYGNHYLRSNVKVFKNWQEILKKLKAIFFNLIILFGENISGNL